jgi:hypothetical protein
LNIYTDQEVLTRFCKILQINLQGGGKCKLLSTVNDTLNKERSGLL